jgi:hypothetical protein
MRTAFRVLVFCGLSVVCSTRASAQQADQAATVEEAIRGGSPLLSLRARYETADQPGKDRGHAPTLQARFGWRTKPYKSLSVTLEAINVSRAASAYNDTRNGKTRHPVIADPTGTDLNRVHLDWTGAPATMVRAGRQSITLDNVRFVGNVAFRQTWQVFDGVLVENRSLERTRMTAAYLGRLRTITGQTDRTDTIVLNANHAITPSDALVGYGYFQAQPNAIGGAGFSPGAPIDTSNQIIGVRADGARPLVGEWRLLYTAEVAKQDAYLDGDARIDARYLRLGGGARYGGYSLRVDHELLGSNDGQYGFQTPLATKHLFQGWADQFLLTPRQGLRDTFVSGGLPIEKARVIGEFHWFTSDVDDIDFGQELDLAVTYPIAPTLVGRLEYADYRAGDTGVGKTDLRRIWLTVMYDF